MVVRDKTAKELHCKIESGGVISSRKGCNIPSGNISIDVLTEKDRQDLKFIAQLNPEYVAASFIGSPPDHVFLFARNWKRRTTCSKIYSSRLPKSQY